MDLSATSHLLAFDGFHAQVLARAFSVMLSALPTLGKIPVMFFIFISLILGVLADSSPSAILRWFINVGLNLVIFTALFGEIAPTPLQGMLKTDSLSSAIGEVYTFRNPGKGAEEVKVSAFGYTPFEAYAYLTGDVEFASLPGANLCSTGKVLKEDTITLYKVRAPSSVSNDQPNKDLYESLYWLLKNSEKTGIGKSLIFLANSFLSVGITAAHLAQLNQLEPRHFMYNTNSWEDFSFAAFADRSMTYGALASYNSAGGTNEIIAPSIQRWPGGVGEYVAYTLRRNTDPTVSYVTKAVPVEDLIDAAESGSLNKDASISPLTTAAANNYYDASQTMIAPQLYIRTHMPVFVDKCRADLNIRASSSNFYSANSFALLDPCRIKVKDPIVSGSTNSASNLNSLISDLLNNLGISAGANQLLSSLEKLLGASGSLNFGVSARDIGTCSSPTTLTDMYNTYSQLLNNAQNDSEYAANRACLEMGKNIVGAMLAVAEQSKKNEDKYDEYRFGGTAAYASMLADQYVYAQVIDGDAGSDVEYGNYADFSSALRGAVAYFKGFNEIKEVPQKEPGVYINRKVKLAVAGGAIIAANELSKNPSIFSSMSNFLNKAISSVKSIGSRVSKFLPKITLGGISRMFMSVLTAIPMAAILILYTMAYYTAIISTALGIVLLTLWSTIKLGESTITNNAGHQREVKFFPMHVYAFMPIGIGLETAALAVVTAMCYKFIGSATTAGFKFVGSLFGAYLADLTGTFGKSVSLVDPLGMATSALAPMGIAFGTAMLPMLAYNALFGREYTPAISNVMHGSLNTAPFSIGAAAQVLGARGGGGGSAPGSPGQSQQPGPSGPSRLSDDSAVKSSASGSSESIASSSANAVTLEEKAAVAAQKEMHKKRSST